MSEFPIENPPIIPEQIKEAIRNRKLIVFTGSGISLACGLPSWMELATNAI